MLVSQNSSSETQSCSRCCDLQGRKIYFYKLKNFGWSMSLPTAVPRVPFDLPECEEHFFKK